MFVNNKKKGSKKIFEPERNKLFKLIKDKKGDKDNLFNSMIFLAMHLL